MSEQAILQGCIQMRLLVYRFIFFSLENEAKSNIFAEGGIILSYPFICSPKVSVAIAEYLSTRSALADERFKEAQRMARDNSFLAGLFKNFFTALEHASKVQGVKSQGLDAIAQAMCAELDVDMGTLRGRGDRISSDQLVKQ